MSDFQNAINWQQCMRREMQEGDARLGLVRGYGEDDATWALRREVADLRKYCAALHEKLDMLVAVLATPVGLKKTQA